MSKKLIAVAVASAVGIPAAVTIAPSTVQADSSGPTVYGRVRLGVQRSDKDSDNDDVIGMENDSSRLGIRGEEDLGNGMSAIYRYEFAVETAEDDDDVDGDDNGDDVLSRRLSWAGVKGSFGSIYLGRAVNAFYGLTGTSYALGNSYTGSGYAMYYLGDRDNNNRISDKTSDSINWRYSTGGLELGATLALDQSDTEDDVNQYSLGARYDYGAGRVSLGYHSSQYTSDSTDDDGVSSVVEREDDVFALFVDFKAGPITPYIGWMSGSQEANGSDGPDVDSYHAGFSGRSGDTGYFLSYDKVDIEDGDDLDIWTIGGAQHLSSRTRIYFEAEFVDSDETDGDSDRQIIGVRHDF